MQKKKRHIDGQIESAQTERGIIVIHTGNGKGKSSSAFGMVARALGNGMKVGVVQFIKGAQATGEERFYRRFPDEVIYHVVGDGFTWETQDKEQDIQTAKRGWDEVNKLLSDDSIDMVVLDELNIVLKLHYLELSGVIKDLQTRPHMQHVIITGRGAPQQLIDIADTVTEMRDIKHAFRQGIKAQRGIEM